MVLGWEERRHGGRGGKLLQERNQVEQLQVVRVVEPRVDGDGAARLEQIGGRRIVDDDRLGQVPAKPAHILDETALVLHAALAEKPCIYDLVNIKEVQHWVRVLGERGREDDDLEQAADKLHELVDARALQDVDMVKNVVDLDGD